MRIRIFQAFASNNSGSYTIVGTFDSPEIAQEVARLLGEVCREHDGWHEEHEYDDTGESPLDAFVRTHGLTEEKPGRGDEWPQYGEPPSVLGVAHQVLVHAPYTVTMPRLFGEFFYKRGGRVEIELDHSHEELAVEFSFYAPDLRWDDPEGKRRVNELVAKLQGLLPRLTQREEHDKRPRIPPAFHEGHWGSRHLTAVFGRIIEGVEVVRALAAEHGVSLRVRLTECPHGVADPLAHLRGAPPPLGSS